MMKTQINPYMLYLFENPRTRTLQWWPLQLILVTSKPNQTKQCIFTPTYYTFLKIPHQGQCYEDLCSWFGWPLQLIMVTSAADLGDHQTKPNQIMHIYPYMIYLFENARPRTLQWWFITPSVKRIRMRRALQQMFSNLRPNQKRQVRSKSYVKIKHLTQ